MYTDRTPLLQSAAPASQPGSLAATDPFGRLGETRIEIDADTDTASPGHGSWRAFWLDHPMLAGAAAATAGFGVTSLAGGITYAATHDWLLTCAVLGAGGTLMGCLGDCIVRNAQRGFA